MLLARGLTSVFFCHDEPRQSLSDVALASSRRKIGAPKCRRRAPIVSATAAMLPCHARCVAPPAAAAAAAARAGAGGAGTRRGARCAARRAPQPQPQPQPQRLRAPPPPRAPRRRQRPADVAARAADDAPAEAATARAHAQPAHPTCAPHPATHAAAACALSAPAADARRAGGCACGRHRAGGLPGGGPPARPAALRARRRVPGRGGCVCAFLCRLRAHEPARHGARLGLRRPRQLHAPGRSLHRRTRPGTRTHRAQRTLTCLRSRRARARAGRTSYDRCLPAGTWCSARAASSRSVLKTSLCTLRTRSVRDALRAAACVVRALRRCGVTWRSATPAQASSPAPRWWTRARRPAGAEQRGAVCSTQHSDPHPAHVPHAARCAAPRGTGWRAPTSSSCRATAPGASCTTTRAPRRGCRRVRCAVLRRRVRPSCKHPARLYSIVRRCVRASALAAARRRRQRFG